MQIIRLFARQILDSRGNPTLEVEASSAKGSVVARVPSGASTGVYEAKELRDGGRSWQGKGVSKAVANVNKIIARAILNKSFDSQSSFDGELLKLDGTPDKSRLGANAILSVSMAYSRLAALESNLALWEWFAKEYNTKPRLPVLFANVLNGGKHAGTGLAMQEFMIVSKQTNFVNQVEELVRTYHVLHDVIVKKYGGAATGVGDEGGFAPPLKTAQDALDLLIEARKLAKSKVVFAIDAASSEFFDEKTNRYKLSSTDLKTPVELLAYYLDLIKRYGVVSLEDPFEEHSFTDFASLRDAISKSKLKCQLVGDDLTVTNPARVRSAIERHSCDCLLLKVNQIGTVSEAIEAAQLAQRAGWRVMVSHRSGETDDAFIAHLVVGLGTGQFKLGAPARGERVAKYNELLRISESCKKYTKI